MENPNDRDRLNELRDREKRVRQDLENTRCERDRNLKMKVRRGLLEEMVALLVRMVGR